MHSIKRAKTLLICLLILISSLVTACSNTLPPNVPTLENTVRTYINELQQNNFEKAYKLTVLSYQYPFLNEIKDQYSKKIEEKIAAQPLENYSINRIAFYENMAIASLRVTSNGKEYNSFLPLVKANLNNREYWLIYSIYPVLQSSTPNSVVASASSEHWKVKVYLILSDQPKKTGWTYMTALKLEYTDNKPVTQYECQKDIPVFATGTIGGNRSMEEALAAPNLSTTDFSHGSSARLSLNEAEKLLRKGKLTISWKEGNIKKSERITFNNFKAVVWKTSIPTNQ